MANKQKANDRKVARPSENGRSSRFPGFYKLDVWERLDRLDQWLPLSTKEKWTLKNETLTAEKADTLIENVIGVFGLPLGVGVNFRIDNKDYIVPMAVEETSIVAAVSYAAKLIRDNGELSSTSSAPLMEGQIQLCDVKDPDQAIKQIKQAKSRLIRLANTQDRMLVDLGGGAEDLTARKLKTKSGTMVIVHLTVDVVDAMGANAVNTMVETLGPVIAEMVEGELLCQIITNLCDKSLVTARFEIDVDSLDRSGFPGKEVAERIVKAYHWADADPYRATTHNKGVLNGIDGILIATGNDWRAVEAACHSYASRTGRYRALTEYRIKNGKLIGSIEVPIAVGTVGGVTKLHPGVEILHKLMGIKSRRELAEVVAASGLIQNFAALRALVTEGIQQGHMTLHARNVATSAGAIGQIAVDVADQMIREGRIRFDRARELVKNFIAPTVAAETPKKRDGGKPSKHR